MFLCLAHSCVASYLLNRRRHERDLEREMASHRAQMAEPHRFGGTLRLREHSAREIGVRMALGARPPDILRTLLTQYAAPFASGSAAGIASAFAGSLVLRGELHGLPPLDPISYAAAIGALAAAMLAAMLLPARRALRISPATALRFE